MITVTVLLLVRNAWILSRLRRGAPPTTRIKELNPLRTEEFGHLIAVSTCLIALVWGVPLHFFLGVP